jgi:hypothetical protein
LDLDERQGLLGKVFGQMRMSGDSGGPGEVPSVSEQVVQADLQALGARGTPEGAGVTALKYPGTGERGLQRGAGGSPGRSRVVTEEVCSAFGHRAPSIMAANTRSMPTRWLTTSRTFHSVQGVGAFHCSGRISAIRSPTAA